MSRSLFAGSPAVAPPLPEPVAAAVRWAEEDAPAVRRVGLWSLSTGWWPGMLRDLRCTGSDGAKLDPVRAACRLAGHETDPDGEPRHLAPLAGMRPVVAEIVARASDEWGFPAVRIALLRSLLPGAIPADEPRPPEPTDPGAGAGSRAGDPGSAAAPGDPRRVVARALAEERAAAWIARNGDRLRAGGKWIAVLYPPLPWYGPLPVIRIATRSGIPGCNWRYSPLLEATALEPVHGRTVAELIVRATDGEPGPVRSALERELSPEERELPTKPPIWPPPPPPDWCN